MCRNTLCVMLLLIAAALVAPAHGGATYDEELNAIWVTDFPQEFPCTLNRLFSVSKTNGWDKVKYDEKRHEYTVQCSLFIGANDGTETYFQIGSKEHPNDTLIVQGDVYILPFYVEGENEGLYYRVPILANRLTLGSPDDANIKTAIKFDNSKAGEFGLVVGRFPKTMNKKGAPFGGQIHVYNSVITALRQEKAYACRGFVLVGQSMVLRNAELSWSTGFLGYGLTFRNRTKPDIVNTVFAHANAAVDNGVMKLTRCTLRDLKQAVLDYGSIDVTFVECTFRDNQHNWHLRTTGKGVTCIDCNIGEPKNGDIFVMNRKKEKRYATVASKRHVVVEVVDPAGKPVRGAQMTIKCEQGLFEMVENHKQTTNAAGRTPAKGEDKALLLTEYTKTTTDTPNQPEVKHYSYSIEVEVKGFAREKVTDVKPTESWKVIRVQMKK